MLLDPYLSPSLKDPPEDPHPDVTVIPDMGEHHCQCGEGPFAVGDTPAGVGVYEVSTGEWHHMCPLCARDLVAYVDDHR
jgi:hypothetical protein